MPACGRQALCAMLFKTRGGNEDEKILVILYIVDTYHYALFCDCSRKGGHRP